MLSTFLTQQADALANDSRPVMEVLNDLRPIMAHYRNKFPALMRNFDNVMQASASGNVVALDTSVRYFVRTIREILVPYVQMEEQGEFNPYGPHSFGFRRSPKKQASRPKKKRSAVMKSRSKTMEIIVINKKTYKVGTGATKTGKMVKYVIKSVKKGRGSIRRSVNLSKKQIKRIVSVKRK